VGSADHQHRARHRPELLRGDGRVPVPHDVHEGYDDARDLFTIDVEISNHRFGRIFHYRGEFTCDYPATPMPPNAAKPLREERRT